MAGYWHGDYTPSNLTFAGGEANLDELFNAAHESMVLVDNTISSVVAKERAYDERIEAVRLATGVALTNPYRAGYPSQGELGDYIKANEDGEGVSLLAIRQRRFSGELNELAFNHPDKQGDILPDVSMLQDAKDLARGAGERFDQLSTSRDGIIGVLAGFAGSMTGALRDPFQAATLVLGGGPGGAKTVGGRILRTAVGEMAVNASIEVAMQPIVQKWRKEAGLPNGWNEAVRNVLFAGGLGAVIGGAGRAIGEGARALVPEIPKDAPIHEALDSPEKAAEMLEPVREALDAPGRGAVDEAAIVRAENINLEGDEKIAHETAMDKTLERVEYPDRIEPVDVGEQYEMVLVEPRGIDDPASPELRAEVEASIAPLRPVEDALEEGVEETTKEIGEVVEDLIVPEAALQGDDGNLVSTSRPMSEIVKETDQMVELADLVRSCKL